MRSVPWLVLSFTTAFMTALLIDDTRESWVLRRGGALGEGAAQAVVTGAAAFIVVRLLEAFGVTPTTGPWVVLVLSSAVGFVIGTKVPSWYRTAPRKRAELTADSSVRERREERRRSVSSIG